MNDRYLYKAKHIHVLPGNEHLDGTWVTGYLCNEHYIANINGEIKIDPSTICQCTGRADEWENDIFQIDDDRYVIVFSEDSLTWEAVSVFSSESISLEEFDQNKYIRLGNAIDNPELLEERNI
ncbi:MAG: hypothetical protein ACI4EE_14170 [Lachnospiraceae bacterium]